VPFSLIASQVVYFVVVENIRPVQAVLNKDGFSLDSFLFYQSMSQRATD